MNEKHWSDAELRRFMEELRRQGWFSAIDETERARFVREARSRVVPVVQRRVLAEVGAAIDPEGAAEVVFEVLDRETWGKRHTWLMVTPRPWDYLTDLVVKEIRAAYRAAVGRSDAKKLHGIAEASTRGELEA